MRAAKAVTLKPTTIPVRIKVEGKGLMYKSGLRQAGIIDWGNTAFYITHGNIKRKMPDCIILRRLLFQQIMYR